MDCSSQRRLACSGFAGNDHLGIGRPDQMEILPQPFEPRLGSVEDYALYIGIRRCNSQAGHAAAGVEVNRQMLHNLMVDYPSTKSHLQIYRVQENHCY